MKRFFPSIGSSQNVGSSSNPSSIPSVSTADPLRIENLAPSHMKFWFRHCFHPVCYSFFLISLLPLLRSILAHHRQLRRLVIALLVFAGYSAVLSTRFATPSFPWELGLYLGLLVWGAFVDQALDLVPCLSLFFSVHIFAFLLFPDVYLKAYPTACFMFSCAADLAA